MNTSKCGSSWHRFRYILLLGKWPYCGGREIKFNWAVVPAELRFMK